MKLYKILGVVTLSLLLGLTQSLAYADINNTTSIEDYENIAPWYIAGIEEAIKWQIMPSGFKEVSMDDPITRGEFAEALILTYARLTGALPDQWDTERFVDQPSVYAQIAGELEFVSGYTDGSYGSNNEMQRQEMFVMINKLINHFEPTLTTVQDDTEKVVLMDDALLNFQDHHEVSQWARQATEVLVNLGIVSGTDQGKLQPKKPLTRSQAMVVITNTLKAKGHQAVSIESSNLALEQLLSHTHVSNEETTAMDNLNSLNPEMLLSKEEMVTQGNNSTKYKAVFGSVDTVRYTSSEEALLHMVEITIDVWTLNENGDKIPAESTIKVHTALAEVFTQVFKEIYEGDEQFPIKNVHGYAWRSSSTSEHNLGLAVDINPTENYMIRKDGTVVVGSYWHPGEDPYSIKAQGDVVMAFKKYGFTWGGDAWKTSNDYMHFSFLGW